MKLASPLEPRQVARFRYVLVTGDGEISQASNDRVQILDDLAGARERYPGTWIVIDKELMPMTYALLLDGAFSCNATH